MKRANTRRPAQQSLSEIWSHFDHCFFKTNKHIRNQKIVPGYDEPQGSDNFKLKDAKNNVILCFKCGRSSLGHREIISCDYCNLKWHLDCLDPPMANPPVKDALNRPKHAWMCPAHVDQELLTTGHAGRVHKIRRPKNAKIVDTQLRRGFKNNGVIEIENEASDSDGGIDPDESSVVYRMSERSVKLDFIDRAKRYTRNLNSRCPTNDDQGREKRLRGSWLRRIGWLARRLKATPKLFAGTGLRSMPGQSSNSKRPLTLLPSLKRART